MARTGLATLLMLLLALPAGAAVPVVRVSGPDAVVARVVERLSSRVDGVTLQANGAGGDLVVAVGGQAFRDAAADTAPVVGIALSRHAWRSTVRDPARQTAIFWEPDPVRQLRLAQVLLPGARRVGVVLGAPDDPLAGLLRREATRLGMDLVLGVIGRDDTLPRTLNRVLADSDFLLGIDDPRVFSPELAKTVLLTSYRHGKAVVGPTAAYVPAGSIASLGVTLEATVDALAAWLPALLTAGELPPPRYLDDYDVATNPQVARSLKLLLPPAAQLDALPGAGGGKP